METKEILKRLRENKGYSIQDVSEKTGISYSVYQKYESGVRGVGVPALSKLADFYGVTTDYLLGRDTAEPPPDPIAMLCQSYGFGITERAIITGYCAMDKKQRAEFIEQLDAKIQKAKEDFIPQEESDYITVSTTLGEIEDRMKAEEDANSKDGA